MSQVMDLLSLQTVDDEAASLRGALAEAERRLQGDEELAAARAALAEIDESVTALKREQRRAEDEIASYNARIQPEERRLYDGSVRNPKELASIQHEVEHLRGRRSEVEDRLLETIDQLESEESVRSARASAVAALEARWARDSEHLRSEVTRLNAAILAADARREARRASLERHSVAVYDDVRRRRGAKAVAPIMGGTCGGCRVAIPESVRRRAMSPELLAQCPNCDRILYVA